jgi:hypothetical protein
VWDVDRLLSLEHLATLLALNLQFAVRRHRPRQAPVGARATEMHP